MAEVEHRFYSEDGEVGRIVRDFARNLTETVFDLQEAFYDAYRRRGGQDYGLRHSGRSIHSTFAAAISRLTPIHLSGGSGPAARRADLWCFYRDTDLLIRLGDCAASLKGSGQAQEVKPAWDALMANVARTAGTRPPGPRPAVALGFLVIRSSTTDDDLQRRWGEAQRDKFLAALERAAGKGLGLLSVWDVPNRMRVIDSSAEGGRGGAEFAPLAALAGAWATLAPGKE